MKNSSTMPPNLVRDMMEAALNNFQRPEGLDEFQGPFVRDQLRRRLIKNWNTLPQQERDRIVGKATKNPLVDAQTLLPNDFVFRFMKYVKSLPRQTK